MLHPNDYYLKLEEAEKLLEAKKWAEAKPLLESVVELYHGGQRRAENPLWLLAATQRHLNETKAELATLQKFASQETDFADLYIRLIDLCASAARLVRTK